MKPSTGLKSLPERACCHDENRSATAILVWDLYGIGSQATNRKRRSVQAGKKSRKSTRDLVRVPSMREKQDAKRIALSIVVPVSRIVMTLILIRTGVS